MTLAFKNADIFKFSSDLVFMHNELGEEPRADASGVAKEAYQHFWTSLLASCCEGHMITILQTINKVDEEDCMAIDRIIV